MEIRDWLPVMGWVVTFTLGIISGGVILPRLTRKRAVLNWALVNESEIVPKRLSAQLGLPVTLSVGSATPTSLSLITVRIGAGGGDVIRDLSLVVSMNPGASILNVRPVEDLGEFRQHLSWINSGSRCRVSAHFLNPRPTL
jgi:hypothetical protein